jgi:hypothetical protein
MAQPTPIVALAAVLLLAGPATAFDRSQWHTDTSQPGAIRLWCEDRACSPPSFLSYSVKPPRLVADIAGYEASIAPGPGFAENGLEVTTSKVRRSRIGRFTFYRVTRHLKRTDGFTQTGPLGLLVGDDVSISLFAMAKRPAAAERNFLDLAEELARNPPGPDGR